MRGYSETEIGLPVAGLLAVVSSVLGLQLGGATTEWIGGGVPITVALAFGGVTAIVGAALGFWVGSEWDGAE